MWRYVVKRFLQLIPAFAIVSFVVFWLMSLAGDPASVRAGLDATPEQIEALREAMGLNRPLLVRYFEYITNLLQGDMGVDIDNMPVWPQFVERFPYTVILNLFTLVVSSVIAIPAGIYAALHKDTWADTGITFAILFFDCMPIFWLAMIMQNIFAVKLHWLPTSGVSKGLLISLILPGVTCVLSGMTSKCRQTRSSMLDNLNADFMRTALAKGVPFKVAVRKHALKNAMMPIYTNIGNSISGLFGGLVTLETVFAWPGMGTLVVPAIRGANFPLACGCITMTTAFLGVMTVIVDLGYAFIDPRVKARYSGK